MREGLIKFDHSHNQSIAFMTQVKPPSRCRGRLQPSGRKSRTNGYMLYAAEVRKQNAGIGISCADMMKIAGRQWSELDLEQKEVYHAQAR